MTKHSINAVSHLKMDDLFQFLQVERVVSTHTKYEINYMCGLY